MGNSFAKSATISVPLPRDDAMRLFTPEGERAWAGSHGWDPNYPDETRTEGVGTVFTTRHGTQDTTWIVTDHAADRIRYARTTPGLLAGTVEVRAIEDGAAGTTVRVTYDLTALRPEALAHLREFEAGYDHYIASWAHDIRRALATDG